MSVHTGLLSASLTAAWVLLAALVGLFTPIAINPDANLGPLAGMMFGVPAGLVVGGAGARWLRRRRVAPTRQARWLATATPVLALVIFVRAQPSPHHVGSVLRGTVVRCMQVRQESDATIARWRERVEGSGRRARAGWESEMRDTFDNASGVVFEVAGSPRHNIYEARKAWNHGELHVRASADSGRPIRLVDGGSNATCDGRGSGAAITVFVPSHRPVGYGRVWPPNDLTHALDAWPWRAPPPEYVAQVEHSR